MHEWWLHSLQLSWFCWGSCSKRLSCVQLPQGERSLSQFLISFVCSFFMVFYLYLASFTPSSCHVSLYLEYVKPTRTSHLISIEHSTKTCHWYRFVQLSKKDGPTFQLDSSMYQQASYLKWFPIMPEVPKSQRMKLWSNSEIAKKTWKSNWLKTNQISNHNWKCTNDPNPNDSTLSSPLSWRFSRPCDILRPSGGDWSCWWAPAERRVLAPPFISSSSINQNPMEKGPSLGDTGEGKNWKILTHKSWS